MVEEVLKLLFEILHLISYLTTYLEVVFNCPLWLDISVVEAAPIGVVWYALLHL